MTDESSEEPKLIIDEDWKTQVQREKEELERKKAADAEMPGTEVDDASDVLSDSDDESSETVGPSTSEASNEMPPPPASLQLLVTSLATQAMAAMGQIPGEDGQSLPPNAGFARHFIDLIGVIEEKTKGNLSEEENAFVQETLHGMRMMFVSFTQQQNQ